MKKYGAILGGAVILSTIVLSVGAWGVNRATGAGDGAVATFFSTQSINDVSTQANPVGDDIATAAVPAKTVYFFPQDGPTTATVLLLVNVSAQAVTAQLTVYKTDGTTTPSALNFGPGGTFWICTDKVPTQVGWTWIDFGPGLPLGQLQLPPSVIVDGYIVWNGTSDTYDPGASMERLPLRFMDAPTP